MTKQDVQELLKEHNKDWCEFMEFMFCQEVGEYEDGGTDYYEDDVNIFINNK